MFKKAFTLAEVLLTIAIIGVVATLTIPNMVNSYKEDYTVSKLKKLNTDFSESWQKVYLKYGNYALWPTKSNAKVVDRFLEFLDVTTLGNNKFPDNTKTGTCYSLKDGTLMFLDGDANTLNIYVGVDGLNGRTVGKHLFKFELDPLSGRLKPAGSGNDVGTNNAFNGNSYNVTNWIIVNENWDYLNCNTLNWANKTSCD